MVTLMIGTFAVAGVGLGWYGHKASLRIESWGRRANERDLIFQQMSGREDSCEIGLVSNRRVEDISSGASMAHPHFPVAVAASK
jgi:hypothetical protein